MDDESMKAGEEMAGVKGTAEVEEVVEEKPGGPMTHHWGMHKAMHSRASTVNWLLFISIFVFFVTTGVILSGLKSKDWVFYIILIGLCFLALSMLAGIMSHIDHSMAMMAFGGEMMMKTDPEKAKKKGMMFKKGSLLFFWVQLWTFALGILLSLVGILGFWASISIARVF